MSQHKRSFWFRAAFGGLTAGLILVLAGDRSAYMATGGINPLDVLKLQVKPNVLVILDTSGSMNEPFTNTPSMGGQFAFSKMAKAKVALNTVLTQNEATVNFGFETYFSQNVNKRLVTGSNTFRYVSDDPNANLWTGGTAAPDGTTDFFRATTTPYTGNTGSNVYHNFGNNTNLLDFNNASGACAAEPCQRFLNSRLIYNNVKFKWNTTIVPPTNTTVALDAALISRTAISCAANHAPIALFPDDPDVAPADGLTDIPYACVQMEDSVGTVTTFWFSTGNWQESGTSNCSGGALLNAVAACGADNVPAIKNALRPELPVDGSCGNPVGVPCGITAVDTTTATPYTVVEGTNPATVAGLNANTALGVIAAGNTPLGASLGFVQTNFATVFPNAIGGVQQNFVILVTDGIETCGGNAVTAATALYNNTPRVYTFVIGLAISTGTLDAIARAGSGGTRDAIPAGNVDELVAALNDILDTAVSTGAFSASSAVLGTVFELVTDDPATPAVENPFDPKTRYNRRINILYQSLFGLPGWKGNLFAFQNDGTFLPVPSGLNFTGNWDAGETLFEQVAQKMGDPQAQRGTGRQVNQFTFFELHNGASVDSMAAEDPFAGGAIIRRRIFTSNGNGAFARDGSNDSQFDSSAALGRNVVALWPPNQAGLGSGIANVDPALSTVGPLDDVLGIGPASNPVLTYADLQLKFKACTGTVDPNSAPVPPECDVVANPSLALDAARKESRQILLAWLAGARLDNGTSDAKPLRALDVAGAPLIYRDRGWILLDNTFSVPAIVGPPLLKDPPKHQQEFFLLRDGLRSTAGTGINAIDLGFGLTNPDIDDTNPQTNLALKPVMSVVFMGANDGLHAFKAETSEEMWSFVPYDQLGKIQTLVNPGQVRNPHVYMVGSSLRFATIFIPDSNKLTIQNGAGAPATFDGRWRRVLYFGRGAGGKFYTALDVTSPGAFTKDAAATNPPYVMWSRGNPDSADPANFAKMGETWSVPAVGDVSGNADDWRVFVGSGFGDTPDEGTTFFELNAINGDVILAKDVADGSGTYIPDNALVAGPVGFNPSNFDPPDQVNPSANQTQRVYIPDIHGRIFKFDTTSGGLFADLGPSQPISTSAGMLKDLGDGLPEVFFEAGYDSRVPESAAPFKYFGYKDIGSSLPAGTTDAQSLFSQDFPTTPIPFRGTVQPVTLYDKDPAKCSGNRFGQVFFAGTRFNPPGADCLSSFDSVIFPVDICVGGTVSYDAQTDIVGQLVTGMSATGGVQNTYRAGNLTTAPTPTPPPPTPTPPAPTPTPTPATLQRGQGSPVCRN